MFCALPTCKPVGKKLYRVHVPDASGQFGAPTQDWKASNPIFGTVALVKMLTVHGVPKAVQVTVFEASFAWGMSSLMREWWPLKISCAGATPLQLWESGNWNTMRPSIPG